MSIDPDSWQSFFSDYFSKLRGKWRKKTADTDFDKKQGTHATMQNQLFFFFFSNFLVDANA